MEDVVCSFGGMCHGARFKILHPLDERAWIEACAQLCKLASLVQKSLRTSLRQGSWVGIQASMKMNIRMGRQPCVVFLRFS